MPIGLCLLDVSRLGTFIPTTEDEQDRCATPRIIHTVARAIVDAEFPDAGAYSMSITKIPQPDASQPRTNTSTGLLIT